MTKLPSRSPIEKSVGMDVLGVKVPTQAAIDGEDLNDVWRTRLESLESSQSSDPEPEMRPSMAEKVKSGWYPGKYMGRSRPPEKEKKQSLQDDEMEGTKQDIEDSKQEAMIVRTLRAIRTKFLERQLVGRIYIYRMSGVIATAVTSEITREDIMHHLMRKVEAGGVDAFIKEDPLIQVELEKKYKRALSTTDTILNSLERRSLSWEGCEFGANTLLTRGSTIGVSDPFIGIIAFSFTLELSATAHSLLASRKRYEATRELASCRVRPSSMVASDPDVAAALAASGVRTSSKDPEQGEKRSGFFSSAKKSSAAEEGEGDGMAVQITDIYTEPIHSLAQQQQQPLLGKAAAGQSSDSHVEV
jgi:hypothetical protein